jgi:hypothetical protein
VTLPPSIILKVVKLLEAFDWIEPTLLALLGKE